MPRAAGSTRSLTIPYMCCTHLLSLRTAPEKAMAEHFPHSTKPTHCAAAAKNCGSIQMPEIRRHVPCIKSMDIQKLASSPRSSTAFQASILCCLKSIWSRDPIYTRMEKIRARNASRPDSLCNYIIGKTAQVFSPQTVSAFYRILSRSANERMQ